MIRLTNILAEIKVNEPGPPSKEAIQKFRDRYENISVIDLLNFLDKHYDEDVTDWWWDRLDHVDGNDSYEVIKFKDGVIDDVISWASQGDQISKELILKQVNEMKVNDPVPKFTNNDQLENYLESDPIFRKKLIDAIWDSNGFNRGDDPSWEDVRQGWYEQPIERFTEFNEFDEIMIDDGDDNRIYISVNPLDGDPTAFSSFTVTLGKNTFFCEYY